MADKKIIKCPNCGKDVERYRTPTPTVDIIIEIGNREIILIKRDRTPYGWAIPGGYVDYGESLEEAAVREAQEETSLNVKIIRQFHTYSDPKRDRRQHNISTVYIASAEGRPKAGDDAREVGIFNQNNLPHKLAFDHRRILLDYFEKKY